MATLFVMIKRNIKMFFKDKGVVLTSMITPIILLLLYSTFLFKVFKDSFQSSLPGGVPFEESLVDSLISGQLVSSLLAVSCVTVAFCSNAIMVADRYSDSLKDFLVTPVKKSTLALSYYISSMISTLIVCYLALCLGFSYMAIVGWHLQTGDAFLMVLDVFLLVNFGTALSSLVHFFLKSQGQMSAVGAIVSACYGFICGAYMPMSNFPDGLQKALSFLPGTYGTVLLRHHAMLTTLEEFGYPDEINQSILKSVDARIFFFDNEISIGACYGILVGAIVVLIGIYVILNLFRKKNAR